MTEFDCTTNTIKSHVPYPHGFEPKWQSVCGSNDNRIVIVDGINGKLIDFNTKKRSWSYATTIYIPEVGGNTSSLVINGNVHILHGESNSDNQYMIYSMETKRITSFHGDPLSSAMGHVAFIKSSNVPSNEMQFYQFGGMIAKGTVAAKYVDWF